VVSSCRRPSISRSEPQPTIRDRVVVLASAINNNSLIVPRCGYSRINDCARTGASRNNQRSTTYVFPFLAENDFAPRLCSDALVRAGRRIITSPDPVAQLNEKQCIITAQVAIVGMLVSARRYCDSRCQLFARVPPLLCADVLEPLVPVTVAISKPVRRAIS
jgi:hypothetical protein